MGAITTHVLDTARGLPAAGVAVTLEAKARAGSWEMLGAGQTDNDGRLKTLLASDGLPAPGHYRLTFDTGAYFSDTGQSAFYPEVQITFAITESAQQYHIPLLLSPYGYSTYRGS